MCKTKILFFAFALSLCVTSCRPIQVIVGEQPQSGKREDKEVKENDRSYPFSALNIPKGHLPPPGECKIWFPGRPPGQQPPPTSCVSAIRNAPLGAWVITHEGGRYKVNIFSKSKKNIVEEIRYYLKD
jgi:hypothetical protein